MAGVSSLQVLYRTRLFSSVLASQTNKSLLSVFDCEEIRTCAISYYTKTPEFAAPTPFF